MTEVAEDKVYTESLVVFLDILGFSDEILENETDPGVAEYLAETLKDVQRIAETINGRAKAAWKINFSAHAFSDSIVISSPNISHKSFIFMAHLISAFQMTIIEHGFLLRGAISAGGHFEDGEVCFGPALVRAYQMERRNPWPRVVIDPLVLQKLGPKTVSIALQSYLSRDNDGLCYFNYLHLAQAVKALQIKEKRSTPQEALVILAENFKQHKECLLTMVEKIKAKRRIDLLPKYHAVAAYHNQYIKELYEHLPLTDDYKQVDPRTPTGQVMQILKDIASSRQGVSDSNIETFLQQFVKALRNERDLLQLHVIDLRSIFESLYPENV